MNHNELYNMINTYKGWKGVINERQTELLKKTNLHKEQIEEELNEK